MSSRQGGRGGRGGGGELPREVQVSKKLSWLLRHGAESEGLKLGPGGYANLQDVLQNRKIRSLKVTLDEVRAVVADNEKQRFTMILASSLDAAGNSTSTTTENNGSEEDVFEQSTLPSSDPSDYLIRANQGHSIKVETDGLLSAITSETLPPMAVHGTTHAAWVLIAQSGGLKPMGRNHIHFAAGLPAGFKSIEEAGATSEAPPVISGMRNRSTILIFLDVEKTLQAGIKLWRSDNGVILSEGNADGIMPIELFKRVEDQTGEGVLVQDGRTVKEAPQSWAGKKKR